MDYFLCHSFHRHKVRAITQHVIVTLQENHQLNCMHLLPTPKPPGVCIEYRSVSTTNIHKHSLSNWGQSFDLKLLLVMARGQRKHSIKIKGHQWILPAVQSREQFTPPFHTKPILCTGPHTTTQTFMAGYFHRYTQCMIWKKLHYKKWHKHCHVIEHVQCACMWSQCIKWPLCGKVEWIVTCFELPADSLMCRCESHVQPKFGRFTPMMHSMCVALYTWPCTSVTMYRLYLFNITIDSMFLASFITCYAQHFHIWIPLCLNMDVGKGKTTPATNA